eukprot:COSAG03_NODE_3333_length_2075_cov_14.822278_3_plen_178_part_00
MRGRDKAETRARARERKMRARGEAGGGGGASERQRVRARGNGDAQGEGQVTLAAAPSPQGTLPFPLTRRAPTTQTPWKLLLSRRRASTLGLPNRSTDGPHTAVTSQRQLAALAPRHTPCAAGNCSRNLPLPSLPSADQTRSTDDSNALATAPKPCRRRDPAPQCVPAVSMRLQQCPG